jgi:hypothetical protein
MFLGLGAYMLKAMFKKTNLTVEKREDADHLRVEDIIPGEP